MKEVLYYSYRLEYNYIDNTGISQGEQARRKIEEIWRSLPVELQIYIGDKQELIASAKALNYSEVSFERNRFSKVFPLLEKRAADRAAYLSFERLLLEEG